MACWIVKDVSCLYRQVRAHYWEIRHSIRCSKKAQIGGCIHGTQTKTTRSIRY